MAKKIEALGIWEKTYHPGFYPIEFDGITMKTGLNRFTLTVPNQIDIQQMNLPTAHERTPRLPKGNKEK